MRRSGGGAAVVGGRPAASSRRVLAVALAGTVAALTACGAPGAGPPPSSAAVAEPEVRDARDARAVDPCTMPTAPQLERLGVAGPAVPEASPEGRRCTWRGGHELTITLFTGGDGLATLARNSEPTTARVRLAGRPALETFTGTGRFCQYDVGVAPGQVVMAALQGGTPDSCTALQAVLPDVLDALPALRP